MANKVEGIITVDGVGPCTSLRRSDGQSGYEHWLKSENESLSCPEQRPPFSYHGSCHCKSIQFDFQSTGPVNAEATFYTCDCNACFKRGYLFFVIPFKHFKYNSCVPSDLGTYATPTGEHHHGARL